MFETLGTGFTSAISWFGELLTSLFSDTGGLKDAFQLISVGFGMALLGRAFLWVKGLLWGY